MRIQKVSSLSSVGFLAAIVLVVGVAFPAEAVTLPSPSATVVGIQEITPAVALQAKQELDASASPRTSVIVAGELQTTYDVAGAGLITIATPLASRNVVSPQFYWGHNSNGDTYFVFNHTDQLAIMNGGSAAIAGALCLLGPAVCIIAAVVVAVALTYLNGHGFCPGNKQLKMTMYGTGSQVRSFSCIAG